MKDDTNPMPDIFAPFTPFAPSDPMPHAVADPVPEAPKKRGRKPNTAKIAAPKKKRGPRQVQPSLVTDAELVSGAAKKPKRKAKRVVKRGRRKAEVSPGAPSLDIATILPAIIGLSVEEAQVVISLHHPIGTLPKRSRDRILASLGKLFG